MIECSPQVQVSHPCGLPFLPTASTNPALDCGNVIPSMILDRQDPCHSKISDDLFIGEFIIGQPIQFVFLRASEFSMHEVTRLTVI
jgi:hypothetical protein